MRRRVSASGRLAAMVEELREPLVLLEYALTAGDMEAAERHGCQVDAILDSYGPGEMPGVVDLWPWYQWRLYRWSDTRRR